MFDIILNIPLVSKQVSPIYREKQLPSFFSGFPTLNKYAKKKGMKKGMK